MVSVETSTVIQFITHLHLKGLKVSTIKAMMSGLRFVASLHNIRYSVDGERMKRVLDGAAKKNGQINRTLPITINILHKLVDKIVLLTTNLQTRCMMKALLLLLYHGCLRIGEALKSGKHSLQWDMVTFNSQHKKSLEIVFKSYKHYKERSVKKIIIPATEEPQYCPSKHF